MRILPVLRKRRHAHDVAPFHRRMLLRHRQHVLLAGLVQLQCGTATRRSDCAQDIGVGANAITDATGRRPAVAERQRYHAFGMLRQNPNRDVKYVARHRVEAQPHKVAGCQPARMGGGCADQGDVVPGQFRERPRQLLQPGIVGEFAGASRRVGNEHGDQRRGGDVRRRRRMHGADRQRSRYAVGDHALAQGLGPECFEIGSGGVTRPSAAHERVAAARAVVDQQRHQFMRRAATV